MARSVSMIKVFVLTPISGFRLLKLTRFLLNPILKHSSFVRLGITKAECLFLIDEFHLANKFLVDDERTPISG